MSGHKLQQRVATSMCLKLGVTIIYRQQPVAFSQFYLATIFGRTSMCRQVVVTIAATVIETTAIVSTHGYKV